MLERSAGTNQDPFEGMSLSIPVNAMFVCFRYFGLLPVDVFFAMDFLIGVGL